MGVQALFLPQKTIGFAATGAAYVLVGSAFPNAVKILKIDNLTDGDMQFSTDQTPIPKDDHFIVPAGGFFLIDFSTNKNSHEYTLQFPAGISFFVKRDGAAPTTGSIFIQAITDNY